MNDRLPVIVFDVNETLSDMSVLGWSFEQLGAPAALADQWFARLLRDGFALAAAGDNADFAVLGRGNLHALFDRLDLSCPTAVAVETIMETLSGLGLHADVADGVKALHEAGHRLVTLSNGAATLAESMISAAGLRGYFDLVLSVAQAPAWKPAAAAYAYAASACAADPADLLLVAVHPWDVHGAARAGLRTAWLNRDGTSYPGHFIAPELTITRLTDLPRALVSR
ncbi:MAG: haloacid dehalogenase type II [Arthrobacter sp.]|uniref:haloacid dehalogenase type II n=1 Tax=unclassified Arthrobacter TaxID=235627 RepID=UPI00264BDA48|nr:haloacid dehalogenase type II [Micrococcaceae bacterium]MDN5813290.1 haloacid dehalogenase type II [Micrococcaceae bacterium]MDN5879313.1 haloacid dehalogenase type II [Micrococcaceae bacterium]MDN5885579.1 haloacid dehalogenase type II [Micrococcaceae bacterium]MDN5906304.1 haloacid dehalogenase type II [Micrococcaceae bacterium]